MHNLTRIRSFLGNGSQWALKDSAKVKNLAKFATASSEREPEYDIVIVGGGVVGLATARELISRHPKLKFAVVEKEKIVAAHQSGHNSGVIHGGIYYKPGTLKAKLCVEGLHRTYEYLNSKKMPYKKCGKLIVAVDQSEIPNLNDLFERGQKNNVPDLKMIDGSDIKKYEPHCRGVKAIWSPHTGIVDWALVTQSYAHDFESQGGKLYLDFKVTGFQVASESPSGSQEGNKYPIRVSGQDRSVRCSHVLTCGGLQSDRLAELSGCSREPRIVPFRGEYLLLNAEKCHLIRGNIYPVPDPRFPFLGVHFTPRMDGSVWLGPNAVPALKREGYSWGQVDLRDVWDFVRFPGFQKMALRYATFGVKEIVRSVFYSMQVSSLQRYIPEISKHDITRGPAGVRAQAMDRKGNLVDDFVFDSGEGELAKRILHCRNAPSPGATSSLAIAVMIADKMDQQFSL